MLKGILLSAFVLGLAGCATTYKDLKSTDIKPSEGVAIARIKVMYNGIKYTENCGVCLNSINGPCQKLDRDGILFMNIPKGASSFRRIHCVDKSGHHYNFTNTKFITKDGVNYIGDINIDWKTKGGFKISNMFGVVGALADEASNDGDAKISVSHGDPNPLLKIYRKQIGLQKVDLQNSILQIVE